MSFCVLKIKSVNEKLDTSIKKKDCKLVTISEYNKYEQIVID